MKIARFRVSVGVRILRIARMWQRIIPNRYVPTYCYVGKCVGCSRSYKEFQQKIFDFTVFFPLLASHNLLLVTMFVFLLGTHNNLRSTCVCTYTDTYYYTLRRYVLGSGWWNFILFRTECYIVFAENNTSTYTRATSATTITTINQMNVLNKWKIKVNILR